MDPHWKHLLLTLIICFAKEVFGAPAGSASKAFSRRTSPRRLSPSSDPTDVLIIPVVSDQDAEVYLVGLGYNEIDVESAPLVDTRSLDSDVRSLTQLCVFPDPKTLAHAFFPEEGDIHFNTRYFFEDDDIRLEDFLDTALHEIGHALGLEHINSKASLMHPTESNQFTEPQPIDIEQIQAIYGSRREGRMVRKTGPKLCTLSKIDAGIDDADGKRYLFAGDYYYDLDDNRPKGKLISSKWPGLPGKIDAAVRYIDDKSYFFKGDKVWRFKGTRLESGYPRLISKAFPGLPSNPDAILVDGDGDLYAFKGGKFWLYDAAKKQAERITKGSVKLLNLPDKLDAALDTDTSMMVFKGTDLYVLQDDGTWKKEQNVWSGC